MKTVIACAATAIIATAAAAAASSLITSRQIKDRTIQLRDISFNARDALVGQDGADGPAGPTGAPGPQGPAGPQGNVGAVTAVDGTLAFMGPAGSGGDVATSDARCPTGQTAISGGANFPTGTSNTAPDDITYGVNARDSDGAGWNIIAINQAGHQAEFYAIAYCASVPANGAPGRAAQPAERVLRDARAH